MEAKSKCRWQNGSNGEPTVTTTNWKRPQANEMHSLRFNHSRLHFYKLKASFTAYEVNMWACG